MAYVSQRFDSAPYTTTSSSGSIPASESVHAIASGRPRTRRRSPRRSCPASRNPGSGTRRGSALAERLLVAGVEQVHVVEVRFEPLAVDDAVELGGRGRRVRRRLFVVAVGRAETAGRRRERRACRGQYRSSGGPRGSVVHSIAGCGGTTITLLVEVRVTVGSDDNPVDVPVTGQTCEAGFLTDSHPHSRTPTTV